MPVLSEVDTQLSATLQHSPYTYTTQLALLSKSKHL